MVCDNTYIFICIYDDSLSIYRTEYTENVVDNRWVDPFISLHRAADKKNNNSHLYSGKS